MKKHIAKIGGALILASVLVILGFKAQRCFGQSAVAYPNFTQATAQQPTTATNIQIATVAVIGGGVVLSAQQSTNVACGLTVGDSNAIPLVSNPFGSMNNLAGGAGVFTNTLLTFGTISNGQAFITILNPNTNAVRLTNAFVKIKLESWQ